MPLPKLYYPALVAEQSPYHELAMISATADEIASFAQIDQAGRSVSGRLSGFQRPQIAGHIREIAQYLQKKEAVLPNAVVLAFVGGAALKRHRNGTATLEIETGKTRHGFVVDGQQRLMALLHSGRTDFKVFAACLLCRSLHELRQQFILINNAKPLPKSLVYELLPTIDGLPERLDSRRTAAALTERMNFAEDSVLRGMIKQQTNPTGVLKDTALQRAIMNSQSAGALQSFGANPHALDKGYRLLNAFYRAVQQTFPDDWNDQKPTTSRLVHGTGIVAMGYVMDEIYAHDRKGTTDAFVRGMQPLAKGAAWSSGSWHFGRGEVVPWNRIEFTPRQCQQLAEHLVSKLRTARRSGRRMQG